MRDRAARRAQWLGLVLGLASLLNRQINRTQHTENKLKINIKIIQPVRSKLTYEGAVSNK